MGRSVVVPDEWVRPPVDWAKSGIQQGKTYDLGSGEGNRILRECMERATGGLHYWNIDADPRLLAENFARYGAAVEVRPRLGQGLFSLAVRDAYQGACAVTREHSLPALEAAHIQPYGQGGEHRIDNGLLLRSDLHRLYDRGYVTVTPDYVFRVGDSLRDDFKNGRGYYGLDGAKIALLTSNCGGRSGSCLSGMGRPSSGADCEELRMECDIPEGCSPRPAGHR